MSSRLRQGTARRICVIGAGVSGLAVAKVLSQDGHQVTVFERQRGPGGVWSRDRIYPGLTTQTPGGQYAFSDFPMRTHAQNWPSAVQVLDYLHEYAEHFALTSLIRYQSPVVHISRPRGAAAGWSVTASSPGKGERTSEFEFAIVCNGIFSTPHHPAFKDKKLFAAEGGVILHSAEFTDPELVRDKRVIVIGFGKSATDIATFTAGRARAVHLLFRHARWPVPKFFGGLVHIRHICTSRLWESLMPTPADRRRPRCWRQLKDLVSALCWQGMETLLSRQFDLVGCGLRPPHKFKDQVTSGFLLGLEELVTMIKNGRIQPVQGEVEKFTSQGVVLSNGLKIDADVVILSTGYRQEIPFFDPDIRAQVVDGEGRYHLYRHLMHPELPDLGFVGYNSSLFTPITSELGARWLAAYITGRLILPTREHMHSAIDSELRLGQAVRPLARRFTGVNVAPYTYRYLDTLLEDIRGSRKSAGVKKIYDFVKPFAPADFL